MTPASSLRRLGSWLRQATPKRPHRLTLTLERLEEWSLLSGSPPVVLISGPAQVAEVPYGTYTLNLTAVDPENDPVSQWNIDWGDGSPAQTLPGNPRTATHSYAGGPAGVVRPISASAVVGGETFTAQVSGAGVLMDPASKPFITDPNQSMGQFVFGPDTTGDSVGDIYAIRRNSDVTVYDGASRAFVRTLITSADGLLTPRCLILSPDGQQLYVNGQDSNNVFRYDFNTASLSEYIPASSGLNFPQALAFGPDVNLYVTNQAVTGTTTELQVLRYNKTTRSLEPFISNMPFTGTLLNMEFRPDGYLYTLNPSLGMYRYDAVTGAADPVPFLPNNTGHWWYGFEFGPDGDLYVSDWQGNDVLHFDGTTRTLLVSITGGGLQQPYEIVFGPDANSDMRPEMYVGGWASDAVHRFAGPLTATAATSLPVTVFDAVSATYASNPGAVIPTDKNIYSWSLDVPDTGPVLDVDVSLNISHPRISDLEAWLVSPTGTRVQLFGNIGGSGANFRGTLNDEAGTSVTNGSAPFSGSYIPQQSLSAFDGQRADGTWKLEIRDDLKSTSGTLNSWSLAITRGVAPSADPANTLRIGDANVIEGDQGSLNAVFEVTLSSPQSAAFTVGYSTADGTAKAGSDYTAVSSTLTFAPGQMRKLITVPILGDTVVEPQSKAFHVNLTASGVSASSDLSAVGTILDNDYTGTAPRSTTPASTAQPGFNWSAAPGGPIKYSA